MTDTDEPPPPPTVNLNDLTRSQLERMCQHYEQLCDVVGELNNGLIQRLIAIDGFQTLGGDVLNQWSERVNLTYQASEMEMRRIISDRLSQPSPSLAQKH